MLHIYIKTTCIDKPTYEFYQHRSSSCYAQAIGSVSNLPLLIIGDYYYSHNKMMKEKMKTLQGYGMGIGECIRLCLMANGAQLGYTVFLVRVD